MSDLTAQIERVVREVLAELGAHEAQAHEGPPAGKSAVAAAALRAEASPAASATAAPASITAARPTPAEAVKESTGAAQQPPAPKQPATKPRPKPHGEAVVLNGRLVTLADLDGRLERARTVLVSPGAVVTPAVRDELERRRIRLGVAAPAAPEAVDSEQKENLRLVLFVHARAAAVDTATGLLAPLGLQLVPAEGACVIAAVDRLAEEVTQAKTVALLVTRYGAAASCLANRKPGLRAIVAHDAEAVARDARMVGANLLIVDPAGLGLHRLRKAVAEFTRDGIATVPETFRKQLIFEP
ncbi:MAG: hypothetical protein ACOY3P_15590 [Planctomycetota bacterium]